MTTVLVVDDDTDLARFVEINLQLEGFEVQVVHDGLAALEAVRANPPDLVLLDVMMPRLDGVEVCRRLRADPATASIPVIMLTAKSQSADTVVGLTAGADDYVIKPFDTLELTARVRSTLRRNAEMRAVSPLTGLPGNHRIDEEIAARVARGEPIAVGYVDLDHFKAFNDRYGFLRGDEVIALLARILKDAATRLQPVPFVGHVGGDDFVIVCAPEQAEELCRGVAAEFDVGVRLLHDRVDVEQGHLEVVDRQGLVQRHPLVSVSIGVVRTDRREFRDHREVVAVATEMKSVAKGRPGSAVAIDRRTDTPTITTVIPPSVAAEDH